MRVIALIVAALLTIPASAEENFEFWPGASYDPSVPTVESVLGHASGDQITLHRDAVKYFDALAEARPENVAVHRYATSWEGRELVYVVVTSAENMARIDEIKDGMQSLRNADATDRARAASIIESQPAVTWLSYGVHGDEISSTDAAMLTAYHLLASRGDDLVDTIMQDSVVVIDPMQNPDGRDRFIHSFKAALGLRADPDRLAAEHDQPWPGGRTNHYLFDLNRNWFALSQPETIGRVSALQEWYPVAHVDLHEMGSDSTYFFAPAADPFSPHVTDVQRANQHLFGRTNAKWFDRFGIDYFTREVYDSFYSGYGDSWPTLFGSIGMTYEQASSRGLVVRKYDGIEATYASTVRNHFVASIGTAETVAVNREKLLQDFYDYQASAIDEGRTGSVRAYIVPTQADQAGANRLAGLLVQQGAKVGVATEDFSACGQSYESGSYVIDLAQPAKRLIRSLLDDTVPMGSDFVAEQERRRAKGIRDQIYDVTAWSLPLMMNIQADACGRSINVLTTPAGPETVQAGEVSGGDGSVAYLIPWGEATAVRFLSNALLEGLAVKSADEAFTHDGNRYPSGTLIIDTADNTASLRDTVQRIAASSGANVVAVDNGWVTDGPSFGSNKVVRHNLPRVAIAWDRPTAPTSAGNMRFVIERQLDLPVSAIRTRRIATSNLADIDVLILPETSRGSYDAVLGEEGLANLRDWVSKGGVLIGVGNANRYLADPNVDLVSIRRENAAVEAEADAESPTEEAEDGEDVEATVAGRILTSEADYEASITPVDDEPDWVSGALIRADVDADHWMGAGVASSLNVLAEGREIYTPIRRNSGVNVARFKSADDLLAGGYLWEENRKQLAFKPFAVVQPMDRGFVIAFTQDPSFRAYLDGLNVIFMNAIFRGAAHARPMH